MYSSSLYLRLIKKRLVPGFTANNPFLTVGSLDSQGLTVGDDLFEEVRVAIISMAVVMGVCQFHV